MSNEQTKKILLYGHPACMMVYPVRAMLERVQAEFEYINIFEDGQARQHVRDINNGYESVPTLVFPDGSTLTEPSTGELSSKLKTMGYQIPLTAMLAGNVWLIVLAIGVLLALLRGLGVF